MAVVAVLILGFTDSISVAIRRTVVQLLAPDGMLGRAASLITVFAQTTNGLGALLAGIAARIFGRAECAAHRQRALLLDDLRHLHRHPAALALSIVIEHVQKVQAVQIVQNVRTGFVRRLERFDYLNGLNVL